MPNPDLLCMGCMEERTDALVCDRCGWREDSPPESPNYLPPRTVLQEQYMMGRALGHGGFAITYLAWDLNLARKLAVKEYLPSGVATRALGTATVTPYTGQAQQDFDYGLEKFLEEARVLARFQNYPGIIAVVTFFRANGTAYLVMEYLDGTTLKEYLANKGGKIPYDTALRLMMPVMDALREVHKAGILHRDISPDNIYITGSGQVKVLDFGAARYALGDRSKNLSVILKEGYAPEEQYKTKGNQGPWTDVYAVGATLYHAITGIVPPPALDRLDTDEIERPISVGVDIEPEAEGALMKALAVRAEDRYPSMEDFQAVIGLPLIGEASRFISKDDEIILQQPKKPKLSTWFPVEQRRRKQMLFTAAALAAVLVVGGSVTLANKWRAAKEASRQAVLQAEEAQKRAEEEKRQAELRIQKDRKQARVKIQEESKRAESKQGGQRPGQFEQQQRRQAGISEQSRQSSRGQTQQEVKGQLDWQESQQQAQQEQQRRAQEDRLKRQQELDEQRRRAQEDQQRRQKEAQDREAQRQSEQLINQGVKALQQIFR